MTKTQIKRNKAFIKALRSGKYKQARNSLRTKHDYCCLGVACEVFRKETRRGKWVWDDYEKKFEFRVGKSHDQELPSLTVQLWLGWNDANPLLSVSAESSSIEAIELNDKYKKRFKSIAKAFERTLKTGDL